MASPLLNQHGTIPSKISPQLRMSLSPSTVSSRRGSVLALGTDALFPKGRGSPAKRIRPVARVPSVGRGRGRPEDIPVVGPPCPGNPAGPNRLLNRLFPSPRPPDPSHRAAPSPIHASGGPEGRFLATMAAYDGGQGAGSEVERGGGRHSAPTGPPEIGHMYHHIPNPGGSKWGDVFRQFHHFYRPPTSPFPTPWCQAPPVRRGEDRGPRDGVPGRPVGPRPPRRRVDPPSTRRPCPLPRPYPPVPSLDCPRGPAPPPTGESAREGEVAEGPWDCHPLGHFP